MGINTKKWFVTAGALTLATALACGTDDPGEEAETCVDYSGVSGEVSFADDVIPLFQQSCTISGSCHLSGSAAPAEGLELGLKNTDTMTEADIDAVYNAIVNVDSKAAEMKLVKEGEPAQSFLLAKCEYSDFAVCDTVTCAPKGCGSQMPLGAPMSDARINILRQWIKAGAKR